ncbi:SGNH/GDSL hydrolase family protein [Pseudophaeobacter arcticus]|uniref:SGNH/GDSL hydrolase family protein n=1 Tax=Pseudophaeobacter arcticus TaxID=385492 RepID=UPI002492B181|nr:SGNH/GDSL hydrolase family protein [Pseudophaeobacter arcticus]
MPQFLSRLFYIFCALLALSGCGERAPNNPKSGVLVMGDSLMAWNGTSHRAVSDVMEKRLQVEVTDRSVSAARMIYRLPVSGAAGLSIPKQMPKGAGDWDWVVLNGGGNDLWLGCGCTACRRKMDRLASGDGSSGAIPDLVTRLRNKGAKVIYTGYLRSPGLGSPIEYCKDEGEELDRRAARMAARDDGVYFLSLADLVPHGDRSYHAFDMIHPSVKGSDAIATRIVDLITGATQPE